MINSHFIGRDPYPIPSFNASSTTVSLSVHQFVELLRGERTVQVNPFHVVAVKAEEHYCLKCLWVRWFDVVYVEPGSTCQVSGVRMVRCRACGRESWA